MNQWILLESFGTLCFPMDPNESQWLQIDLDIDLNGPQWIPMAPNGSQWPSLDSDGLQWILWIKMNPNGSQWIPIDNKRWIQYTSNISEK